ncbi:MAG: hypothetical protein ACI80V_000933 [Rhodothermales bacterium]|jgi:hypothetical protein
MTGSFLESLRATETAFRFFPQELVDILMEVRSLALGIKPWATERIRPRGLTVFDPTKGGTVTGGICFVDIRNGIVRVRSGRGSVLDDPRSVLSGKRKLMRHLDIRRFEEARWDDLESLLRQAANLDESRFRYEYLSPGENPSFDLEANKRNAIAFYTIPKEKSWSTGIPCSRSRSIRRMGIPCTDELRTAARTYLRWSRSAMS